MYSAASIMLRSGTVPGCSKVSISMAGAWYTGLGCLGRVQRKAKKPISAISPNPGQPKQIAVTARSSPVGFSGAGVGRMAPPGPTSGGLTGANVR